MRPLPEEIEQYRDRKWHREESLRVDSAPDVEAMVEELGFCLGLTDVRKNLPSVYIAVCGRTGRHVIGRSTQEALQDFQVTYGDGPAFCLAINKL